MSLYKLRLFDEWITQQKFYKYVKLPRLSNFFVQITVDIESRHDSYVLVAEIPGAEPKNITVEYETGTIHLSVTRNNLIKTNNDDTSTNLRKEIVYDELKRSVSIPGDVDANNISAHYANGMLRLDMKKKSDIGIEERKTIVVE